MRRLFAVGVGLHLADVEKIVSAVNPPPLDRVDVDHAFGRATGRDHRYSGLEIRIVDLKALHFDQPRMQVIALQNAYASQDITAKAGPAEQCRRTALSHALHAP